MAAIKKESPQSGRVKRKVVTKVQLSDGRWALPGETIMISPEEAARLKAIGEKSGRKIVKPLAEKG